ncbi:bifunctional phosphopantothenoylcysteine decarboxylase/phosphopantothenate--cysteine ligase CoaBC [Thiorhodospira sibirica]|uniref:bifunctional phosphopantothenoylcysteine decarboxylase/phosphopantothenate--cysteine ligase CoaBC n=1 Tax=Thiorhodospira sibirica TaxID=154347 RepID=UPI00022C0470
MGMLHGRRVLLGVTGSVAAYKACDFVRRLQEAGCEVRVVMTAAACEFVAPLSFQALSGFPVRSAVFDAQAEAGMDHISLARWAEVIVIAPASANFIARLAHGLADDLLSTLCLARLVQTPLCVAPAMNHGMWLNAATQENVSTLRRRGVFVLGPGQGVQACGEVGEGRLLEIPVLLGALEQCVGPWPLRGRRVVLTAGPTREALDPVRYVGNRSSGRMGYALAQAAACRGAEVVLVSGPCALAVPYGVRHVAVESAAQMREAVLAEVGGCDVFIGAAAVADYRAAAVAAQKLKKGADDWCVSLVRNPDILAEVAALGVGRPFVVGFAAETGRLVELARDKLVRKGLDMIAANDVSEGQGFDVADNALSVLWGDGGVDLPRQSKEALAHALLDVIVARYLAKGC